MTYMINLTAHGGEAEDVKAVFEDTVRALRTLGANDPNAMVAGSVNGTDSTGESFNLNVNEVTDLQAADTDDTDDSPVATDDPHDAARVLPDLDPDSDGA